MNCATHNETAAVAFCRTCGKPLCANCTRDVRGVVYCEPCLAARLEGTPAPPQAVYQQVMDQGLGMKVPPLPPSGSGPNPTVAGILAGFFPFGVGAVYTGQYAKGLAHLVVAVLLIIGVGSDLPWFVTTMLGIGMGFFYVYQIIDSVRTAKALQMGQPPPDPFGLGQAFGMGEKVDASKVPAGSVVLIGLGVLFLLHTLGFFEFGLHRFWPLILIFLGVWLFAKNWGLIASSRARCFCEHCRTRGLMAPAMLVTLGVLFLLDSVESVRFGRTWPAILLVVGVVKLVQSNSSLTGHIGPAAPPAIGSAPPPPPVPSSEPGPTPSSGEVRNV
jgi:Domain of unknown function (DUF5668)/B-box zinc finger